MSASLFELAVLGFCWGALGAIVGVAYWRRREAEALALGKSLIEVAAKIDEQKRFSGMTTIAPGVVPIKGKLYFIQLATAPEPGARAPIEEPTR